MARRPRQQIQPNPLLEWDVPYNPYLYKELPRTYEGPLEAQAEIAAAEASLYGWWWRFLKANPAYPPRGAAMESPHRAALYRDFGELGDSFAEWWTRTGRVLFHENGMIPVIQITHREGDPEVPTRTLSLEMRIPMTISREAILEQFNMILKKFHPGNTLLRHEFSTARRRIYPRPRYRRDMLDKLLAVWRLKQERPELWWWQIGEQLELSRVHMTEPTDSVDIVKDKHEEMSQIVRKLYDQAKVLVENAAMGQFPRDDRIVNDAEIPIDDHGAFNLIDDTTDC